ncbi:MAG: hypothetical protein H3C35_13365 [Bacteroidetes bacterium]|nr:hypothetical protein [Bacteroidota bacterium]
MKDEKLKEEVEKQLLQAMGGIDNAVHTIVQKMEAFHDEEAVDTLVKAKREIKKVLNNHFDRLARNRAVER